MAAAFMEAWDRGDAWKDAIRKSLATYDQKIQDLLRQEIAKGIKELGDDPKSYGLAEKASDEDNDRAVMKPGTSA